jgi:hypothetical protein
MIKAIGVYLAQVVLALTGNPALAASLKLLPKAATFRTPAPEQPTISPVG